MNKTFLIFGRASIVLIITALALAACGGSGSDSQVANVPAAVTQAGVIISKSMGGTAIVGQEYKGQIEVTLSDASVTVASLSIVNNVAGGGQPSIDEAGNITWTPVDKDFAGIASLRVTGNLSNGAVISANIPTDVRKVRVVVQKTLADIEQIYSDDEGRYLVNISKKTTTSVISGELTITETYRKNGEFSWLFKATGDGFNTAILQAPATQRSPLMSAFAPTATQAGVVQSYPISELRVGSSSINFSDINENGAVMAGGSNVYTSRPAGNVTYFNGSLADIRSASLDGFPVFWFGSNCATDFDSTYAGKPSCASNAQAKSPIILIHGFSGEDNIAWNESIVGGDVDTWGQTANLLTEQGHPVFEMRWLSYMPFEDAAGALAKFGKDIAILTGKKPIILAHSFGGVVSHLALQNKGREWKSPKYGAGQWEAVNTDRVFAKLITLNSPLSGINANGGLSTAYAAFNPIKKVYNNTSALQDVAFPRGVDSSDGMIKLCYSITCAQAGATFNNNGSFKSLAVNKALIDGYMPTLNIYAEILGGVARSLKEGETIADMQTGIAQSKGNAPYLTVTGFRPYLQSGAFSGHIGLYSYGDGLISLMGQAAIPQDFSDQAFDGEANMAFKFKFETNAYPTVLGNIAKLTALTKGDCLKYDVSARNYLVCGYSAHTASKITLPVYGENFEGPNKSYAVANYDGSQLMHVMPRLVFGVNYLAATPAASPFSLTASQASTIKGRLGASTEPRQVGLVGSTLTPVKFAVIWATIIEKSTGVSKHYFSGAQSDNAGQFNIDIGSAISNKFGATAALADYRIKLKIDVVGYKSWSQEIETLGATVDLGDIDLALTTSNIHSISPAITKGGTTTSFTIIGTNLPATANLDITFNGCASIQFVSQSATQHQFACTPPVAGTLTAVVRTLPGTTPLGSFPVVVAAATVPTLTALTILQNGLYEFEDNPMTPCYRKSQLSQGSVTDLGESKYCLNNGNWQNIPIGYAISAFLLLPDNSWTPQGPSQISITGNTTFDVKYGGQTLRQGSISLANTDTVGSRYASVIKTPGAEYKLERPMNIRSIGELITTWNSSANGQTYLSRSILGWSFLGLATDLQNTAPLYDIMAGSCVPISNTTSCRRNIVGYGTWARTSLGNRNETSEVLKLNIPLDKRGVASLASNQQLIYVKRSSQFAVEEGVYTEPGNVVVYTSQDKTSINSTLAAKRYPPVLN